MSSTPKLTKKQKKALAFRERKGKGKETEIDGDNAVPVMEDQDLAESEVQDSAVVAEKGDKKIGEGRPAVVEGKKRKRRSEEDESEGKEKRAKKTKKELVEGAGDTETVKEGDAEVHKTEGKTKVKQQRFILFVGNLKYTTTKEAVQAHFNACVPPPSVRLMTPKPSATGRSSTKSKGFAFVEFVNKKALQEGLKLHHTELQGRMINVELTAGGGGKSEGRITKLKTRNKELFEQRKKRLENQKMNTHEASSGLADLVRPQRYSATSGVDQVPTTKRTWTVEDTVSDQPRQKKRGSKKPPRSQGTGVNAIPVG